MQSPAIERVQLVRAFSYHAVEKSACPIDIPAIRPGADKFQINSKARRPGDKSAEFRRVFLGGETSAAAPGFIADSPILDIERLAVASGGALIRKRCFTCRSIAVFDPFIEIFRRQAAQICGNVWFHTGQLAKSHELIRAEPVRVVFLRAGIEFPISLTGSIPAVISPEIRAARAVFARADAVAPVIAVGETAPRPAHDARFDPAQMLDQFFSNAADIGDFGIFTYPDTVIDHPAEMLHKMAVNVRGDLADLFIKQDFHSRIRSLPADC